MPKWYARTGVSLLTAFGLSLATAGAAVETTEEGAQTHRRSPIAATAQWALLQLVPSPLLVYRIDGVGGGVRWQLTPVLYSFGVTEKPWRFLRVAPVARHAGAIESFISPEWACCAGGHGSAWLGRAGARVYWPVIGRGETLASSFGGSYYYENGHHGGAAEWGLYTLSSLVGLSVTVSPWLTRREVIFAMTLHLH